jgi:glycosyltransferase involved in cell wall biosynthesis
MHLIALKLKEALGLPWVADFRDPWTEIDYYSELHLTKRSDRKHHRLEYAVLTKADKVVTVAPDGAQRLEKLGAKDVVTIYNGFDRDDDPKTDITLPNKFTITYLGVLSKIQNPENLWIAIKELVEENDKFSKDLKINIIGQIDKSVTQFISEQGLNDYISYSTYIPHNEVSAVHRASTLLLLLLMPDSEPRAKGLLTGKLFEYLASGRPILCIGPEDGDAAKIINETNAGTTVSFEHKEQIKDSIRSYYQRYLTSGLPSNDDTKTDRFSRKALAGEYALLLNTIAKQ